MRRSALGLAAVLAFTGLVLGHPHFRKTVEAATQTVQVKVSHFTVPYNAAHLADVTEGFVFHCGNGRLTIASGQLSAGQTPLPAGDYLLRARARNVDDWELLLIPAALAGDPNSPDLSQAISLNTRTTKGSAEYHHLTLDLHGGHGETDGKLIISVSFGPRTVEGVLNLQ